jgi:hypothetical protein
MSRDGRSITNEKLASINKITTQLRGESPRNFFELLLYYNTYDMRSNKSVVRSVVKKIVCNDRIIALKLKAEPVDILIMQVYMPTSEYEDDEVEKV